MNSDDQLDTCKQCTNRTFNRHVGLVCSLTNDKPDFEDLCPDFEHDFDAISVSERNYSHDDMNPIAEKVRAGKSSRASFWFILLLLLFIARIILWVSRG